MMKRMKPIPAMKGGAKMPAMPKMANGGQVGKAMQMAGNAKSGTCGPGMTGNRDYKK